MARSTSNINRLALLESLESRCFLSVTPLVAHPHAHHAAPHHHKVHHAAAKVTDPIGPYLQVISVSPVGDTSNPISTVIVTFNRLIDPFSITNGDFQLTTPDHSVIAPDAVSFGSDGTQLIVTFPAQSAVGTYTFSISSTTTLAGMDGTPMAPQTFTSPINLLGQQLPPPVITSGNYPTFSATATPLSTVTWKLGGNTVGTSVADASGIALLTLPQALSTGSYSMTAIAADNSGRTSAPSTPFAFRVASGATAGIDGTNAIKTELDVVGTDKADQIVVQYVDSQTTAYSTARVVLNGKTSVPFNFTGRIVVHGLGGNDLITVDQRFSLPALLYGDAGNNLIVGGGGSDTLVGGPDSDTLYGQAGNDTLIGNGGRDQVFGGDGVNQIN